MKHVQLDEHEEVRKVSTAWLVKETVGSGEELIFPPLEVRRGELVLTDKRLLFVPFTWAVAPQFDPLGVKTREIEVNSRCWLLSNEVSVRQKPVASFTASWGGYLNLIPRVRLGGLIPLGPIDALAGAILAVPLGTMKYALSTCFCALRRVPRASLSIDKTPLIVANPDEWLAAIRPGS